jgi:hypothetical protein
VHSHGIQNLRRVYAEKPQQFAIGRIVFTEHVLADEITAARLYDAPSFADKARQPNAAVDFV